MGLWNYVNKGKTFDDVIPSQFPNMPPDTGFDEDDDDDDEDDE